MSLSQKVVKRPILITIVFAILVVISIYSIRSIPLDLIPSISPPYVMVNTSYVGAGPETVEKTVTKVLESGLSSVQGLKNLTSTSSEGSSTIILEFNYGKDLDKAANDIRDKVDSVRDYLPSDCSSPSIFKLDPNSSIAHYNLARFLAKQGNHTEAISHYREALTIQPADADAHNNLGIALAMKGKLDEAIAHFQAAIRSNPKYASAHSNLGNALAAQQKWDDAIKEYREVRTLTRTMQNRNAASQKMKELQKRQKAARTG